MLLTCEIVCGTSLVAISDAFFDQPVRPRPPEEAQPAESAVKPSMHPDEFIDYCTLDATMIHDVKAANSRPQD